MIRHKKLRNRDVIIREFNKNNKIEVKDVMSSFNLSEDKEINSQQPSHPNIGLAPLVNPNILPNPQVTHSSTNLTLNSLAAQKEDISYEYVAGILNQANTIMLSKDNSKNKNKRKSMSWSVFDKKYPHLTPLLKSVRSDKHNFDCQTFTQLLSGLVRFCTPEVTLELDSLTLSQFHRLHEFYLTGVVLYLYNCGVRITSDTLMGLLIFCCIGADDNISSYRYDTKCKPYPSYEFLTLIFGDLKTYYSLNSEVKELMESITDNSETLKESGSIEVIRNGVKHTLKDLPDSKIFYKSDYDYGELNRIFSLILDPIAYINTLLYSLYESSDNMKYVGLSFITASLTILGYSNPHHSRTLIDKYHSIHYLYCLDSPHSLLQLVDPIWKPYIAVALQSDIDDKGYLDMSNLLPVKELKHITLSDIITYFGHYLRIIHTQDHLVKNFSILQFILFLYCMKKSQIDLKSDKADMCLCVIHAASHFMLSQLYHTDTFSILNPYMDSAIFIDLINNKSDMVLNALKVIDNNADEDNTKEDPEVSALKQNISELQDRVYKLSRNSLTVDNAKKLQHSNSKLESEKLKLTEELSEEKNINAELRDYIDKLEQLLFSEDTGTQTTEVSDDEISNMNIVVVGGHQTLHAELADRFPKWKLFDADRSNFIIDKADLVVYVPQYSNHGQFWRMKRQCSSKYICFSKSTGVDGILTAVKETLVRAKQNKHS